MQVSVWSKVDNKWKLLDVNSVNSMEFHSQIMTASQSSLTLVLPALLGTNKQLQLNRWWLLN